MEPSSTALEPTPRQARILFAVCRDYILHGEPVSSRALQRGHGFDVSSATLRNELAALERLGLVVAPHHAAGRLPTAAGLARYVTELRPRVDGAAPRRDLARAIEASLADPGVGQGGVRAAVDLLSGAGDCVAVAVIAQPRPGAVRGLHVVPSAGGRAIVVLEFDGAGARACVQPVSLDERRSYADERAVERLQQRLRELCVGRTLDEARTHLLEVIRDREVRVDEVLVDAIQLGLRVCAGAAYDPLHVQVVGQPALVRRAGGELGDDLAAVLGLLEDVHRLADVLWQLLPPTAADDPHVQVCLGPATEALLLARGEGPSAGAAWRGGAASGSSRGGRPSGAVAGLWAGRAPAQLALVGCRVPGAEQPDASRAALAVLGPGRLDYASLIPLLEFAARAMAARVPT
jgi:heat-inducible transcriptional repressor